MSTDDLRAGRQISAVERLLQLPEIFSGRDLTVRFQWPSKTASHYLWLWKKRGLIDGLGGKSDVFANLLKESRPDWEAALRMAMPGALIVGIDALRRAGWTTQVPHRPEVAVPESQTMFSIDRFEISTRSSAWMESSRKHSVDGVLSPAWALADMLFRDGWGTCGLTPDDVALDAAQSRDRLQWKAAARAYGLPEVELHEAALAGERATIYPRGG